VKTGRLILRTRHRLQQVEDEESLRKEPLNPGDNLYIEPKLRTKIKTDDRFAKATFREVAKKIELVRKTSSPILKVIKFAHAMEEL
jgi:hypothetical protein